MSGYKLEMPSLPEGWSWSVKLHELYLTVQLRDEKGRLLAQQDRDQYVHTHTETGIMRTAEQIWARMTKASELSEALGIPVEVF